MNRPLFVGLFVLAGLALFATGLFMIGNRHEAFARHMNFYTEFSDLSGIAKGAKVQVAGMDAGEHRGAGHRRAADTDPPARLSEYPPYR